jgi:hypothetical protein
MKQFFTVYQKAVKDGFKHIRVSENIDAALYEMSIAPGITVREWIAKQDIDYTRRLKSLISSTHCPIFDPQNTEESKRAILSDFYYENQVVPILGAVYLLKQLSLSFNSNTIWDKPVFKINHSEMISSGEIIDRLVDVNNVTSIAHWEAHYVNIEQLQKDIIRNSADIVSKIEEQFQHIIFIKSAIKQLESHNISPVLFNEIWEALKVLDNMIENNNKELTLHDVRACTNLDISDESISVKQNPKLNRHRRFFYNDAYRFFWYHIKNFSNAYRLHFLVEDNKIVVGYIGKHLPT